LTGLGLFVCGGGAALDVLYHASPPTVQATFAAVLGDGGGRAHLLIFVGMTLVLLAVVRRGLAQTQAVHTRPSSLGRGRAPPGAR
jgi:hypothetical protein